MIALDTETTPITADEPIPRIVCVSFASERGCEIRHVRAPGLDVKIASALVTGAVFANAPFDILAILRQWPDMLPNVIAAYNAGRISDVCTREELIDIAEGVHFQRGVYSLAAIAERRAGVQLAKDDDTWRMRYGELLETPVDAWPAEARDYAVRDAAATWLVWQEQERYRAQCPALDVFADEAHQVASELPLYEQTALGIPTDQAKVEALDRRLEKEIAALSLACIRSGLARVERGKVVRNTKAAAAMFEPLSRARTATGRVSLSEQSLAEANIPEGHPLDAYRRLGAMTTLRTSRIPPLRNPVVRTRYGRAESGRTTSSAPQFECWPGTNLQNQPKEGGFRECLVPPPGFVLGISDYSAQELVTLAQVQVDWFGRSALGDALREGRDPHWEVGARMAGLDPHGPVDKHARQGGKAFNFGKPGGMGIKRHIAHARAAYGVNMTEAQVKEYTAIWHDQFPEMRLFFERIAGMENHEGWITIVQPRSLRIRGRCRFPDACNTTFQGLASDVGRTALWWLWCACRSETSPLYGSRVLLFEHDAFATAMPADRAEAALAEQERIMIAAAAHWCPDVPQKVESVIADCYRK